MERALNSELLNAALGTHSRLPTPDELGELLAQAEIDLFLGRETDHSRILRAGWYLHAVAGARPDGPVSGIRRQQAGRVSAHIFDVFLQGTNLELTDEQRLRHIVSAQYGYLVGDLAPNATAMTATLDGAVPAIADSPGRATLHAAALLLGLDRRRLREGIDQWELERAALADEWADVESSPFAPALAATSGIGHLLNYLTQGDAGELDAAASDFQRALRSPGGNDDTDSRWVAALLSDLGGDLATSSVWSVLPPDRSPTARALVLSEPSVLLFWPPQAAFLRNDPSPLDPATRRQVLAFPTSAGKTLVSQVMILSHLQAGTGDVCVVAPTHSLCREIRDALQPRLRLLRTGVVDAGPQGAGSGIPATGRVVVMTPERFAGLLRANPSQVLDRFGLFVIDEAHLLAERERGWGLEEALTLLHHLTERTSHRLVLVSAAMGVGAHVVSWLTTDGPPLVKSDDWRGPRRLYALYTTSWDRNKTTVEAARGARRARRRTPVRGHVHLRQSEAKVRSGTFADPVGVLVQRQTRAGGWERAEGTTTQLQQVVPLIEHLVSDRSTPTLVIVATREDARKLAGWVADLLPEVAELSVLATRIEDRVGQEHALPSLVRRGVAYHHGALPTDVQAEIEDAARACQIRCLVATATLTEGVNLPFKAVVIASTGYGAGDNFVEIIDPPRLVNALGRAGRACRETEAWLFLVRHAPYRPDMFGQLRQEGADLPLRSSLLAAEALDELAGFEQLLATGADAAVHDTGTATNEFCAFVWRLAELLGGPGTVPDLDEIMAVVESSLAWSQADEQLRRRWRRVAAAAKGSYDRTPPALRRRYAQSGASLAGAAILDQVASTAVDAVVETQPETIGDWLDVLLGDGRLQQLLELPENRLRSFKPYRSAPAANQLTVDLLGMLQRWVAGDELDDIGAAFLGAITNSDYRAEALSEFTSSVFEHHLPWAVGSVIEWMNVELLSRLTWMSVPAALPSHIHFGVPTNTAVELMAGGVRSRRLAQAVSDLLGPDVEGLRATIAELGLQGWRDRLGASPAELRDLLSFVGRPPDVITRVLEGGAAQIPVTPTADHDSGPARLRLDETESEPLAINVVIGAEVAGTVAPDVYNEVRQLLDLGFPLDLQFDSASRQVSARLATGS